MKSIIYVAKKLQLFLEIFFPKIIMKKKLKSDKLFCSYDPEFETQYFSKEKVFLDPCLSKSL